MINWLIIKTMFCHFTTADEGKRILSESYWLCLIICLEKLFNFLVSSHRIYYVSVSINFYVCAQWKFAWDATSFVWDEIWAMRPEEFAEIISYETLKFNLPRVTVSVFGFKQQLRPTRSDSPVFIFMEGHGHVYKKKVSCGCAQKWFGWKKSDLGVVPNYHVSKNLEKS